MMSALGRRHHAECMAKLPYADHAAQSRASKLSFRHQLPRCGMAAVFYARRKAISVRKRNGLALMNARLINAALFTVLSRFASHGLLPSRCVNITLLLRPAWNKLRGRRRSSVTPWCCCVDFESLAKAFVRGAKLTMIQGPSYGLDHCQFGPPNKCFGK